MRQVLLSGKKDPWSGVSLTVWAPDRYGIGDTVRWNGCPWKIAAVYGTHFAQGLFAKKREKPNDSPLENLN